MGEQHRGNGDDDTGAPVPGTPGVSGDAAAAPVVGDTGAAPDPADIIRDLEENHDDFGDRPDVPATDTEGVAGDSDGDSPDTDDDGEPAAGTDEPDSDSLGTPDVAPDDGAGDPPVVEQTVRDRLGEPHRVGIITPQVVPAPETEQIDMGGAEPDAPDSSGGGESWAPPVPPVPDVPPVPRDPLTGPPTSPPVPPAPGLVPMTPRPGVDVAPPVVPVPPVPSAPPSIPGYAAGSGPRVDARSGWRPPEPPPVPSRLPDPLAGGYNAPPVAPVPPYPNTPPSGRPAAQRSPGSAAPGGGVIGGPATGPQAAPRPAGEPQPTPNQTGPVPENRPISAEARRLLSGRLVEIDDSNKTPVQVVETTSDLHDEAREAAEAKHAARSAAGYGLGFLYRVTLGNNLTRDAVIGILKRNEVKARLANDDLYHGEEGSKEDHAKADQALIERVQQRAMEAGLGNSRAGENNIKVDLTGRGGPELEDALRKASQNFIRGRVSDEKEGEPYWDDKEKAFVGGKAYTEADFRRDEQQAYTDYRKATGQVVPRDYNERMFISPLLQFNIDSKKALEHQYGQARVDKGLAEEGVKVLASEIKLDDMRLAQARAGSMSRFDGGAFDKVQSYYSKWNKAGRAGEYCLVGASVIASVAVNMVEKHAAKAVVGAGILGTITTGVGGMLVAGATIGAATGLGAVREKRRVVQEQVLHDRQRNTGGGDAPAATKKENSAREHLEKGKLKSVDVESLVSKLNAEYIPLNHDPNQKVTNMQKLAQSIAEVHARIERSGELGRDLIDFSDKGKLQISSERMRLEVELAGAETKLSGLIANADVDTQKKVLGEEPQDADERDALLKKLSDNALKTALADLYEDSEKDADAAREAYMRSRSLKMGLTAGASALISSNMLAEGLAWAGQKAQGVFEAARNSDVAQTALAKGKEFIGGLIGATQEAAAEVGLVSATMREMPLKDALQSFRENGQLEKVSHAKENGYLSGDEQELKASFSRGANGEGVYSFDISEMEGRNANTRLVVYPGGDVKGEAFTLNFGSDGKLDIPQDSPIRQYLRSNADGEVDFSGAVITASNVEVNDDQSLTVQDLAAMKGDNNPPSTLVAPEPGQGSAPRGETPGAPEITVPDLNPETGAPGSLDLQPGNGEGTAAANQGKDTLFIPGAPFYWRRGIGRLPTAEEAAAANRSADDDNNNSGNGSSTGNGTGNGSGNGSGSGSPNSRGSSGPSTGEQQQQAEEDERLRREAEQRRRQQQQQQQQQGQGGPSGGPATGPSQAPPGDGQPASGGGESRQAPPAPPDSNVPLVGVPAGENSGGTVAPTPSASPSASRNPNPGETAPAGDGAAVAQAANEAARGRSTDTDPGTTTPERTAGESRSARLARRLSEAIGRDNSIPAGVARVPADSSRAVQNRAQRRAAAGA